MNILIIDNDKKIREGLHQMLLKNCSTITSISEAHSVSSGLEAIHVQNPDLLFLDIELDDGSGFDILKKTGNYSFPVIFITAYNKYAVDAFRFSALDFLLKPIDTKELTESIEKAQISINTRNLQKQFQVLYESLDNIRTNEKKIVLKDNDFIHFIKVRDIIRCEADGAYTKFYLINSSPILISKGLKEYDDLLINFGFIRCHHSHLVNTSKILRYEKIDGGSLVMENNDHVPVSQRKRDYVLDILNKS